MIVYRIASDRSYAGPVNHPDREPLPSNVTASPPPSYNEGQLAYFIAGVWMVLSSPPADAVDHLAVRKAALLVAVHDRVSAHIQAGYPVEGDGQLLHLAMDDGSRADMTAMATTALGAASGNLPWPASYQLGWITIENIRIPMPAPDDGLLLAASAGDWYATLVQHGRDLKDAVISAADDAALDAIDIEAGWS